MSSKNMTVRLDPELAAALEAVARADEMPVSEAVRNATDAHIEMRRGDAEFRERLAKVIERDREVLERLRDEPVTTTARRRGRRATAAQSPRAASASGRIRLNAFHLASLFLSGCGLSHQEPRSRRFLRMVRRR